MKYMRITLYSTEYDYSYIVDSNGYFDELWELSANFMNKGFKIIAVGDENKFLNGNAKRIEVNTEKMVCIDHGHGRPIETTLNVNGKNYKAITVADTTYVPDREELA